MVRVAVVTGANKGIGRAVVEGLCRRLPPGELVVYLTSRDTARGRAALDELARRGLRPEYHQLDVADRESVRRFAAFLKDKHGGLDYLVNNAAIAGNDLFTTYEDCKRVVDVDYRSLLTVQELLFPLLRDAARVVNVSSDCGHLSNVRNRYWVYRLSDRNLTVADVDEFVDRFLDGVKAGTFRREDLADGGTLPAYRVAKVAVSALTRLQQKEVEARGIAVNSVHPGLVRTDMTAGRGVFSPERAADTLLYLLLDAPATLRGQYVWFDRRALDWLDHEADCYFKIEDYFRQFAVAGPALALLVRHRTAVRYALLLLFLYLLFVVIYIFL